MINTSTFEFLKQLRANNDRDWMAQHRDRYLHARDDVRSFADELIAGISAFDPAIAARPPVAAACVTRINRRFPRDIGPYKTDFYIVIGKQGIQGVAASYAVHVEPGNNFVGGGAPNPRGDDLLMYRRRVSEHFDDFDRLVTSDEFTRLFPHGITSQTAKLLKRVPRGFEADDPAADVLRRDGFITREPLTQHDLTDPAGMARIMELLQGSRPLIDFLNRD